MKLAIVGAIAALAAVAIAVVVAFAHSADSVANCVSSYKGYYKQTIHPVNPALYPACSKLPLRKLEEAVSQIQVWEMGLH